jgi:hypothetical protein
MHLVFSSSKKPVRTGDDVHVQIKGEHGFKVVGVSKPNSKKPQGVVSVKTDTKGPFNVAPTEIGAEWVA